MTDINPIKFGVAGQYPKQTTKEDLAKQEENQAKQQVNNEKQVSSNDVLNFMAAQNLAFVPTKTTRTINVSKYVTPEQEARIAGFMKGFEADYEEAAAIAQNEFGVDEKTAGSIALAYINATY